MQGSKQEGRTSVLQVIVLKRACCCVAAAVTAAVLLGLAGAWIGLTVQHCGKCCTVLWMQLTFYSVRMLRAEGFVLCQVSGQALL